MNASGTIRENPTRERKRGPQFASIRAKVLSLVVLGLVVPLAVAAVLIYRTASRSIYRHSLGTLEDTLTRLGQEFWTLQKKSLDQVTALARSPLLISALENGQAPPGSVLDLFQGMNPHWRELRVFDRRGAIAWPPAKVPDRERPRIDPFYLVTSVTRVSQEPVEKLGSIFTTRFGVSVDDGRGKMQGLVTASLELNTFQQLLQRLRVQEALLALAWDDRDLVFASNLTPDEWPELGQQFDLRQTAGRILSQGRVVVQEIRLGSEGFVSVAGPLPDSIRRWAPIAGEDWFLALFAPRSLAFSELDTFRNRSLLGLSLLAGGCLGLLFWLLTHLTSPLASMSMFASRVARGERRHYLDLKGRDEVAQLGGALNDMTRALERYEKDLVEQEVLASLGRMSSIVSHEVRNSLNAMRGSLQLLQLRRPEDELISKHSAVVLSMISHLTRFVESLLGFSRLPPPRMQEVRLAHLIQRNLEPFTHLEKVRIRVTGEPGLRLTCDPDQMGNVLHNLVGNSVESLQGPGEIDIEAAETSTHVEIRIRDNGPGIPKEVQTRLFEPFTTSKPGGTGLGLVVCRMVARNHGGTIELVSTGPHGTHFRIVLPKVR